MRMWAGLNHDRDGFDPTSCAARLARFGGGGIHVSIKWRPVFVVICGVAMAVPVVAATQQQSETFKGRLSPVPVNASTARTTLGAGSVTAMLAGNTLTITGTFDGLNSPATLAHLHRAPKGLRGPNVFDLIVTKAASGTVEGRLSLTTAQIEDLKRDWYYVQIHTEKNPEGHLRGWLLQP
jgi:hypothetical protein